MTNPEDLHSRFSGLSTKARFALGFLIVGVAVAATYFAKPAWREIKHYRALAFSSTADKAHTQGNLGLALEKARAALQLEPQNPDIVRMNARFLTEVASDAALPLWQNLAHRSGAPLEDQLDYLEAALAFQQIQRIGPVYSNLCNAGIESARLQRIGALYQLGLGSSNAALDSARAAYRLEPTNPTNALLIASLVGPGCDAADREDARARLREVAQSGTPLRLIALRQLVQSPISDRSDREWVEQFLTRSSQLAPAESVLLGETRIRLDPTSIGAVVSNLVSRIPHDDPEMLTLVVDTLSRFGRHAEVLNLTLAGRSLMNRTLFQARYEALVALDRPDEAYRHLLQENPPLPAYDLALAKVQAAMMSKNSQSRESHLAELVRASANHPAKLRSAAELAEQKGATNIAIEAWKQLGTLPGQSSTSLRALQRLADRRGDTWTARDYARNLLRAHASLPGLKLEIAYYDLLLGENIEAAFHEAQTQSGSRPRDFFPRTVLALAHLRRGAPDAARVALERFYVEEPQLRPDALAVIAATLGQNGYAVRAGEIASKIPLDRLRPEERELVRPWITPPSTSAVPGP